MARPTLFGSSLDGVSSRVPNKVWRGTSSIIGLHLDACAKYLAASNTVSPASSLSYSNVAVKKHGNFTAGKFSKY